MDIPRPLSQSLRLARRHPLWTAAFGVALVLSLVLLRGCFTSANPEAAYYEVKRGDFLVTIVEGGTLEAVNEVVIRNEVEGNARIIYIVPEGSYVKKGDVLVRLDTADAVDKVNQQEIAYEKAKAALVQAEKNLEIERSVIQSAIDAADLKVKFAVLDLHKFQQGQMLQELRDARSAITTAQGDLLLAQDNFDWSTKLYERGFDTKNNVDQSRNDVLKKTLALERAQTNLWVLTTFDHPKMLKTYESSLEEARNDLERVRAQGDGKLVTLQADLSTQSNSLALTSQKLVNDKDQLAKSTILAPQDGLVVYAVMQSRFSSQSLIEEGAMIRERQELIKLPDTAQMKVTIKVHESHVNKVRAGQAAFVVLDPMPDQRFQATVSKVAVLPDTQSSFGNPNLKVYKTEVIITDALPDVKPGVSARAEIVITNIPQALTVPIQAVTTRKGKPTVFVQRGGQDEPVPVEVGLFNTKFIAINSGISEGDRVLLSPPYDLHEKDLGGAVMAEGDKIPEAQPGVISVGNGNGAGPAGGMDLSPDGGRRGELRGPSGGARDGADRSADGPRSGERRPGGERSGFNREEMLKRFDTNGDGELDETERAAMIKTMGGKSGKGRSSEQRSTEPRSSEPRPSGASPSGSAPPASSPAGPRSE